MEKMGENKKKTIICEKIEEIIKLNLRIDHSLTFIIGNNFEYNHNYIRKIFKQQKGLTIKQCHEKYLLGKAISLLKNKDSSCLFVSIEIGFRDDSNFNRWFRRLKGITPMTYKKSYSDNQK